MKRTALFLVLLIGLAVSSTARAQQPTTKSPTTGSTALPADSVSFKLSPELKKSLDDLAAAVQALAIRVTTDPEVKAAAMQVASGLVMTAQQVVTEQSAVIAEALKAAAERISAAQSSTHEPLKKP